MTDKTQPEAGSTHIIRYALELGLLWIDGDGRNKVREALDALDALEAKLASIGAGGVQALSAAPEIHEPKCPALDGAGCTCAKHDPTIDRAWAQFCGGIGDWLERAYREGWAACRDAETIGEEAEDLAFGNSTANSRMIDAQQAAPKAAPGDELDEALRERDDAEDFIDALLDEVLGHERPEWSSSYGRADALNDVQERMTALHKPAVDWA